MSPDGLSHGLLRGLPGSRRTTWGMVATWWAAMTTVTLVTARGASRGHEISRPEHNAHMFDLTDTSIHRRHPIVDGDARARTSQLHAVLRTGVSDSKNNQSGAFSDLGPWSAWTPCSRSCKQRRHRCRGGACNVTGRLVEKRSCWRAASRHKHCKVRRHRGNRQWRLEKGYGAMEDDGIDEGELQEVVYDLLYYDWTPWTACTRSCKRRRFRVCALRRFCKNTVLMEERQCYVAGSECEKRYFSVETSKVNSTSTELLDKGNSNSYRRVKKRRRNKPTTTPEPTQTAVTWDPASCGLRNPAMDATPRIVGGQESRKGAWPWQVAIITRPHREQYCGGVLISPYHVLTAAHCVRRRKPKRRVFVRVGEFDLGQSDGTERDIRIAQDTVHAAFNLHTIDSDIAVLRLKTPVRQSALTNYACVPQEADVLSEDTLCFAVGWGKMKETHLFGTDRLREAEVPLVTKEKCQEAFEYEITGNQMCAGYLTGGVDTCAGDSGGPLMCRIQKGGQERWHVYGVTSFGEGCGEEGKYGIYTRVSNFSKWIEEAMRTNTNSPRPKAWTGIPSNSHPKPPS